LPEQKTIRRRRAVVRPWFESLEDRLAPTAATASNQELLQSYGQLPMSFEVNAGQTDGRVRYLARGSGYALFLTSMGAVLNLESVAAVGRIANPSYSFSPDSSAEPTSVTGVALAMNLIGASADVSVTGLDQLPGTSNYFIGNDPSRWHTNIANYGQVAYQGVYPGINLLYYGNQQQLEYDFVVGPGADPSNIRFAIQGADSISLDAEGNLVLSPALGDVLEHAPVVYQEVSGVRQAVAGQFMLLGQDEVGFKLGTYDSSRPLTIDPVLSYSTYLGGSGGPYSVTFPWSDESYGIAVDGAGNAYVSGITDSIDFPTTAGAYQTSLIDTGDAFVTKFNASGTALVYSTYLGGMTYGFFDKIAVDSAGSAYITGVTSATDFPTTPGAYETSFQGGFADAFVTKLNATGTGLIYSTYLGGSGGDYGNDIAVDGAGNAYVTGDTSSTNFPTTGGAFRTRLAGSQNAFVTKLNATGTALVYSTLIGGNGSGGDGAFGIALDGSSNAYVTGFTSSSNFPTTAGAYQTQNPVNGSTSGINRSAFVTKLNATGSALIYSTYLGGGAGPDTGKAIAVDGSGNAYVTGTTGGASFPTTPGAYQRTPAFVFVTKLNATGTALSYSTYLGNSSGWSIAVDGSGDAYAGGSLLTKLNAGGTALIYSTSVMSTGSGDTYGVALDPSGSVYVTGWTSSTTFPTTSGAYQTSLAGTTNAFLAKFARALDPAKSTIAVAPAAIPSGGSATVTITARDDEGQIMTAGGLPFIFDTTGGSLFSSGTFSNLADNHNGTYTAIFTASTALSAATYTITATLNGQAISSPLPTITVAPVVPATQLAITNLSATSAPAGSVLSFTVTAEDNTGAPVPSYTGTVQLASTDSQATAGGNGLPASYTFIASDNGSHTFTVTLQTAGTQTITASDQANNLVAVTGPITVMPGPFSKFLVSVPGASTLTAGSPFLVTVQAADQFGNPVTSYSGPTAVIVAASPPDPEANPIPGTLNSSGFGFFLGSRRTAGPYTLSAAAGSFTGTSASILVSPAAANHFSVTASATATTGSPVSVTVTALDPFR
jgi:hypothetical protein